MSDRDFIRLSAFQHNQKIKRNWLVVPNAKPIIGNQFGGISNIVVQMEQWADIYGKGKRIFECNILGSKKIILCSDEKACIVERKRPYGVIRDVAISRAIDSIGYRGKRTVQRGRRKLET